MTHQFQPDANLAHALTARLGGPFLSRRKHQLPRPASSASSSGVVFFQGKFSVQSAQVVVLHAGADGSKEFHVVAPHTRTLLSVGAEPAD